MGKRLAIRGHSTRGNEVIELLEMMGGKNFSNKGNDDEFFYYIDDKNNIDFDCTIWDINDRYTVFTLEEFLEKYPFKVGDFVRIPEYESEVRILKMKWCPISKHIEYLVCPNDEDEWFTADELLEDNDNPTKMRDCKKCGLHFGSVRCFDKDCPHNSPKSYAVGLKDGKVIECGVNKEIDMNDEVKPIFKVGDEIARADGLTNSCIVIGINSEYYSLEAPNMSGVGVLPVNKQDEYILVNRTDDKEPEPKAPILSNRYDYAEGKCGYVIPDGYEFDCIKEGFQTEIILKPKKPTYPKTYEECCEVLDYCGDYLLTTYDNNGNPSIISNILNSINILTKLLICHSAYCKIAGVEMGLGKPWEPDWENYNEYKYCLYITENNVNKGIFYNDNHILAFPTEEMRDAFFKNFKGLIEQCKELL